MTVRELIIFLEGLNQDLDILVSRDPEGNKFTEIDGVEVGRFENQIYEFYPSEDNDDKLYLCVWPT